VEAGVTFLEFPQTRLPVKMSPVLLMLIVHQGRGQRIAAGMRLVAHQAIS
jgi:hypothetical protein